jgi:hypothetical protein
MTTSQIKALFEDPRIWIRKRKFQDNLGRIVREFVNVADSYIVRYVITDPLDLTVLSQVNRFGTLPRLKDLKNPEGWLANPPVGTYVFCCTEYEEGFPLFAVTPKAYWETKHCLDDQSLAADDVFKYGLVEVSESLYEMVEEYKDPKIKKAELIVAGFIYDPDFENYINRFNH